MCCLCFGLRNDTEQKKGQFAHLDHDPKNNSLDNIAFLCLEHHAEYDGKTSQAASITKGEIRRYRSELYEFVRKRLITFVAEKKQVDNAVQYWIFKKGPTKAEINAALEFYAGPHRMRSGMLLLDMGPKSLVELQAAIPGALDWIEGIINDLVDRGWAFRPHASEGEYRISSAGERILRILDAIPTFIKDAAWNANWRPDEKE